MKSLRAAAICVIVCVGIITIYVWNKSTISLINDLRLYQASAVQIINGIAPASLKAEYPPLATAIFVAIERWRGIFSFATIWSMGILLAIAAATVYIAIQKNLTVAAVCLASIFCALLLLHFELFFGRFDIYVGMLLLLSWFSWSEKRFTASAVFLILAGFLKIVPFAAIPLLILATPVASRREIWKGFAIGAAIACVLPLLLMGFANTFANIQFVWMYHTHRGIQVESTWSGINLLIRYFGDNDPLISYLYGSLENVEIGRFMKPLALATLLIGTTAFYVFAFFKSKKLPLDYARYLLILMLWLLATSTVLSPQYFLWIAPLAVLFCIQAFQRISIVRFLPAAVVFVALCLLTQWIYPFHYDELIKEHTLTAFLILNARNVLVVLMIPLVFFSGKKIEAFE